MKEYIQARDRFDVLNFRRDKPPLLQRRLYRGPEILSEGSRRGESHNAWPNVRDTAACIHGQINTHYGPAGLGRQGLWWVDGKRQRLNGQRLVVLRPTDRLLALC